MQTGIGIAVGCAAIAISCSSAPYELPPGSPEVRAFCEAAFNASADRTYACYGGAREALTAHIEALDYCHAVAVELGAAHVTFDAAAAAACLADIPGLACWQTMYASPNCNKVFTGTVAEGGECYPTLAFRAEECVPGTDCSTSGSDCTGKCVVHDTPPRSAVIGGPCTWGGDCAGDDGTLSCVDSTGPIKDGMGTCQVPAESGSCNYSSDCLSGACAGTLSGFQPGMCLAAPKHLGDACTPMDGECGPGATCAAATNTCVVYPAIGEPCAGDFNAANQCLDGVCFVGDRCARYGRRGDPCDAQFDTCGVGMVMCDRTTLRCAPECGPGNGCGARGQICCVNQRCNAGLYCSNGVCR